jgi:hypothetical protein
MLRPSHEPIALAKRSERLRINNKFRFRVHLPDYPLAVAGGAFTV